MKSFSLFLISLICLSCGGLMQGKPSSRMPASVNHKASSEVIEQRHFLSALKAKYEKEQRPVSLAIVRSMMSELDEKYPSLPKRHDSDSVEILRKRPEFLSLEFTIEHLSHRESVKLSAIP